MNSSFVFVELNDLSARVNYILNPIRCTFVSDLSFPHVILQFMHGKEALFLGMSPLWVRFCMMPKPPNCLHRMLMKHHHLREALTVCCLVHML